MGRARRQRLDGVAGRVGQDLTGLSQQLGEGDRPQPHAAAAQEITAGQKRVFEPGGMMGHGQRSLLLNDIHSHVAWGIRRRKGPVSDREFYRLCENSDGPQPSAVTMQ